MNSQDAEEDSEDFLEAFPAPFRHDYHKDATEHASSPAGARGRPPRSTTPMASPKTQFGGYASEAKLDEDIRRYALSG